MHNQTRAVVSFPNLPNVGAFADSIKNTLEETWIRFVQKIESWSDTVKQTLIVVFIIICIFIAIKILIVCGQLCTTICQGTTHGLNCIRSCSRRRILRPSPPPKPKRRKQTSAPDRYYGYAVTQV
ncbi:hypothetical protein QKJ47_gp5 [Aruac virus]|uniref:Uncharacterized protein n=1 Tax=Aruac virus TaxID=1272961 RepID=A0A0D3R1I2_9RHAB|nr:hypothetical protein QKJ47_gp5 [Aruac virus]AJR28315.1 hypothetical protein [Aruac virus]